MGPDQKLNAGGESPGEQRLDTKTREAGVGFHDRAKWQTRNLSAVGQVDIADMRRTAGKRLDLTDQSLVGRHVGGRSPPSSSAFARAFFAA